MASIVTVCEAVVVRARPVLPEWNTFADDEPSPIPFDAFSVQPDPSFADYRRANSPHTVWQLRMGLYVKAADLGGARRKMGELTDTRGPLKLRLENADEDIEDDLFELSGNSVHVTVGRDWSTRVQRQRFTDVRYQYCYLGLSVGTR